ncbi:SCO family protein [Flagellimonas allohymeniacidonis]|uniref:SCO family protein n=1 Tax=Flagellimonas allohymeniacidonis TaxID=2517819 RepID=A0A4V2HST9_9FLAO|nr:SCO family protein [Allomuricauda hymeniacidonis]TAI49020.1 SCO family protein [Allomuricauda hymeniacidonis]
MSFKKYKQTKRLVVFGTIGVLFAFYIVFRGGSELPVIGPKDFNPELVDNSLQHSEKPHTVADFTLINQNGRIITQSDYKNKIYVADFFFTRCPSICPIMSNNMGKLQEIFLNNDDIMLLSMSVTPEMDNVSILREYANRHGVVDTKWNITTGDKKHIYNLARKSYFAAVDEGDGGLQDFIHTPNFVLVDRKKQIRGVYNGTDDDDVLRLIDDIKILAQ